MYKEETDTVKYSIWIAQALATGLLVLAQYLGAISWPWWVIISPIWMPYMLAFLVFAGMVVLSIAMMINDWINKQPRV